MYSEGLSSWEIGVQISEKFVSKVESTHEIIETRKRDVRGETWESKAKGNGKPCKIW
jgi:hypothetical protein